MPIACWPACFLVMFFCRSACFSALSVRSRRICYLRAINLLLYFGVVRDKFPVFEPAQPFEVQDLTQTLSLPFAGFTRRFRVLQLLSVLAIFSAFGAICTRRSRTGRTTFTAAAFVLATTTVLPAGVAVLIV